MSKIKTFGVNNESVDEWIKVQSNLTQSIERLILDNIEANNGIINLSVDMVPSNIEILNKTLIAIYNHCEARGEEMVHVQVLYKDVEEMLRLSNDSRNLISSIGENVFEKRLRFGLLRLKESELILNPKRGFYKTSNLGSSFVKNNLTLSDLKTMANAYYVRNLIEKEEQKKNLK